MRRDAALGLALAAVASVSGTVASLVLGQGKGEGTPRAVTYAGKIPCADCPVQRIVLTLFPDFTFRLRRTYVGVASGKDREVYDLGRWARAQDEGDRLRLTGGAEAPLHFRFVAPDRLRMLDREGREIRSTLNYELARQPAVDPVAGPMPLRGMYSYLADAALFDECLTGKRFPVALEAAHAEVERAYRDAGPAPGTPVLVTLDGRFDEREVEGPKREHVIVEALGRFWPGEKCAKEAAAVCGADKGGGELHAQLTTREREAEGLRASLAKLERGESILPEDAVVVAVSEAVIKEFLDAQLPFEAEAGSFKVRLVQGEAIFKGSPAVHLTGEIAPTDHPDLVGEIAAQGALENIQVDPGSGMLRATIAIDHVDLVKMAGLEKPWVIDFRRS